MMHISHTCYIHRINLFLSLSLSLYLSHYLSLSLSLILSISLFLFLSPPLSLCLSLSLSLSLSPSLYLSLLYREWLIHVTLTFTHRRIMCVSVTVQLLPELSCSPNQLVHY
eukprot:sb/3477206/